MLPWLITAAALLALLFYWLYMVKRELSAQWEAVLGADKQARLYWVLLMDAQNSSEKRAYMQERYNECCNVYIIQARKYLDMRKKGLRAPAARLLGFPKVPEEVNL